MNPISEFFIRANKYVIPLLNSPFRFPLSMFVTLIKFTGRKSGGEFITPVGYNQFDKTFLIALTNTEKRKWWRNYREPWPMELCHKGKWLKGTAVVIPFGTPEYKEGFEKIFNNRFFMPYIMKIYDYKRRQGMTDAQLAIFQQEGTGLVKFVADS